MAELLHLDREEQDAVQHAREKLVALGNQLPFPHQSGIRRRAPLRELRPQSGRCRWRPLYAPIGEEFVILAITPEAYVDATGFRRGLEVALGRLAEPAEEEGRTPMNPKKLVRGNDVLARQLQDPALRAAWEATSLARAVAIEVVKYRADHGLSQAVLAEQLGVSQPVVARLERGDHTPTWDTLSRLARTMDVHFLVEVDPHTGPRLRQVS